MLEKEFWIRYKTGLYLTVINLQDYLFYQKKIICISTGPKSLQINKEVRTFKINSKLRADLSIIHFLI